MFAKLKKRFQKQLNQFHDFYFGIKPEPDISVDDIFILGQGEEEKDPFKKAERLKSPSEVKVLAIQDGYVQYEHFKFKYFNDPDSMELDSFLYVFRKKEGK